jgi:hypothetical protein
MTWGNDIPTTSRSWQGDKTGFGVRRGPLATERISSCAWDDRAPRSTRHNISASRPYTLSTTLSLLCTKRRLG